MTQYLTAEAVNSTLEFVAHVSGSGSAIVFTYVKQEIIAGAEGPEWFHQFTKLAQRIGSPLIFGFDPTELESYLGERGLKLVADVGAADYQERYLKPVGRILNVFEGERTALALVT